MKRLFLAAMASAMLVPGTASAAASAAYINNGVVDAVYPNLGPRIDATTFINRGSFSILSGLSYYAYYYNFYLGGLQPYETWNTLNYTNTGIMAASPGFRFDLSSSEHVFPFNPEYSANFANIRNVSGTNASIYGESLVLIQATNVVNSGTIASSDAGFMKINGQNINMTRGSLELEGLPGDELFFGASGIQNLYWGVDTNRLTAFFSSIFVESSSMTVTMFDRLRYITGPYWFALTNGFNAYVNISQGANTDFAVDVLILSEPAPGVSTEVRFFNTGGPTPKMVQWQSVITNRVTAETLTNSLYLIDYLATDNTPTLDVNLFDSYGTVLNGMTTARPDNYILTQTFPGFTNIGVLIPPQPVDATLFAGSGRDIFVTNTAYGARITAEPHSVDPALAYSTYSNVMGRIEVNASKVLDLTRTRIQGNSYLRVESTNHFVGSTNARIISPFSTFKLASTNSSMTIANLLTPSVPCVAGEVEVWSGRWTNENAAGSVLYNVTIVDGRLAPEVSSFVDELELRATNLVIADVFNVLTSAKLDAERVTIATNLPTSPSDRGELNLLNDNFVWSWSFPRMRYFTNYGGISCSNSLFFAASHTPPWQTGSYEEPYNTFVNYGDISSHGNDTWANYFEFAGTNNSGYGPISVRSVAAFLRNGAMQAPNADITLVSRSLSISNMAMSAARSITLEPTDYLSDGSLETSAFNVTNKNVWYAGGGLNLTKLPAYGSLLATTVALGSYYNLDVVSQWAGADRGCVPEGFVNNAAVGQIVLDGASQSMFTFTGSVSNNAIYVDRLELTNAASIIDPDGERTGIYLAQGMKFYFAQAIADGKDISSRLNGRSGGQFCWVSAYAGAFSGTNMVYPDGSTNLVNAALANDCDLDSDGDGVPNCLDSSPVTNFWVAPVVVVPPATNYTGGDGSTGGDTNPPASSELPTLEHPENTVPYSGLPTTVGSYYGLFYDSEGVTLPGSGFCKITVTSRGVYSGRLQIAGKSHTFTGRLSEEFTGTNYIQRLGNSPLSISFEVDDTEGKLEGKLTDGSWTAGLVADRVQSNAKAKSPFAGRYTMVVPAAGDMGCGYGTVLVTTGGGLVWNGRLGDGSKVTQTAAVSREGVWPLYAGKADGQSVAISWLQLSTNDLSGKLIWIQAGSFTNEYQVVGSKYVQPRGAKRAIELFATTKDGHGRLVFLGGGVGAITNSVVINNANKATFPTGSRVTLQIVPGTGLFQGKFVDPSTGKLLSFYGALLQEENYGAGLFMNGPSVGQVYLTKPVL